MTCDMCGKEGKVYETRVEGTVMEVCEQCTKYGVRQEKSARRPQVRKQSEAPVETLVDDFARLVKEARERRGWTQEDLAKKAKEKESVVRHVEQGELNNFGVAKKLEGLLGIKLIRKERGGYEALKSEDAGSLTIGDMLKRK